jgi:hypothetical protein
MKNLPQDTTYGQTDIAKLIKPLLQLFVAKAQVNLLIFDIKNETVFTEPRVLIAV